MEYSFIMWKDLLPEKTSYLCSGCKTCDGTVCINQLPGWGGINSNRNFILNYSSWEEIQIPEQDIVNAGLPEIALAPMTGMVQNAGLKDEKQGYFTLVESAANAGIKLSIGDGEPDYKLEYGIEALKTLGKKAAVFIKPYENHELKKRIGKSLSIAECIGIDIDAWEIKTMKNSSSMPAAMEKKNLSKLKEIKSFLPPEIPFVIKGVADQETLNMILELKPFAAGVSNSFRFCRKTTGSRYTGMGRRRTEDKRTPSKGLRLRCFQGAYREALSPRGNLPWKRRNKNRS